MERSGPVHRLGAKLSEIQAGLMSVQKRLEQKSPNVTIATFTQKVSTDIIIIIIIIIIHFIYIAHFKNNVISRCFTMLFVLVYDLPP